MPLLLDDLLLQVTAYLSADPRAGNTQEMLDTPPVIGIGETTETRRRSAGTVAKIWPLEELLNERTITNSLIDKKMRATWPKSRHVGHMAANSQYSRALLRLLNYSEEMKVAEATALICTPLIEWARPQSWCDLGSGRGTFTIALAQLLTPGSTIYAIDFDQGALEGIPEPARRRGDS
jgi:hypothetical protein